MPRRVPARDPYTGRFLKGGAKRNPRKRKKGKRRAPRRAPARAPIVLQMPAARRRNPMTAAMVNPRPPGQLAHVLLPAPRRRVKSNPVEVPKSIKALAKPQVLIPVVVGGVGGIGAMMAMTQWVDPKVGRLAPFLKIAVGLLAMPTLNRMVRGSGAYFAGAAAAFALKDWIEPRLRPFIGGGDMAGTDEEIAAALANDMGMVEFVRPNPGDLGGMDDDEEVAELGDDVEELIEEGGQTHLSDAEGVFPPAPVPPPPPMLIGLLRRRGLMWLLRLGVPHDDIRRIMRLPPRQRRIALRELKQRLHAAKGEARRRHGARFGGHRMVTHHPRRFKGRGRGRGFHRPPIGPGRGGVHMPPRPRPPGSRGPHLGNMYDDDDALGMGF